MSSQQDKISLTYTSYRYGQHSRQRVGVWKAANASASGRWIVFIHGGAWRDPNNTLEDFLPSIEQMARLPEVARSKICGYASIDYRLSAHQDAPPSAASRANGRELTDARHPDHILDVRAALECLDSQVQLQDGYVLIGHSAGAMLAYQVLMGAAALAGHPATSKVPLPAALIGISGIYDIPGLLDRNLDVPAYYSFISGAFGKERSSWAEASPARFMGAFADAWSGLSILAHSPDDSLVDAAETEAMFRRLCKEEMPVEMVYDLSGEHDVVWQEGSQLARLVVQAIQHLGLQSS